MSLSLYTYDRLSNYSAGTCPRALLGLQPGTGTDKSQNLECKVQRCSLTEIVVAVESCVWARAMSFHTQSPLDSST